MATPVGNARETARLGLDANGNYYSTVTGRHVPSRVAHKTLVSAMFAAMPATPLPTANEVAGGSLAAIAATPAEIRQSNRERLDTDAAIAQQEKLVAEGPKMYGTKKDRDAYYASDLGKILTQNNGGRRIHPLLPR